MKTIRFTAKSTSKFTGFRYHGHCVCGHVGAFHTHPQGLLCPCGLVHEYMSQPATACGSVHAL